MSNPRRNKDWLDSFLEYTKRVESPESFRLWTGISTIAACLQRKCVLPYGELSWYPNLYIVLVAPAGQVRKTTIMRRGRDLLTEMNIKVAPNVTTRQQLIRILGRSTETEIDPSTGSMDVHCSLTVFNEELTTFLGYNDKELMTILADWYDCGDEWRYETKNEPLGGGGTIDDVKGVWVNLLGATTPQLLRASIPSEFISGGLASRTVFVYEDKGILIKGNEPRNKELEHLLLLDLELIKMLKGSFTVTEEYEEEWEKFRYKNHHSPPFRDDSNFGAYVSRRQVQIAKLAMVLNASRSGSMILDGNDIRRAIVILEKAEKKMQHVFGGVGDSLISDLVFKVRVIIEREKNILVGRLLNMLLYDTDVWHLEKAIDVLDAAGYLDQITVGGKRSLQYKDKVRISS